MTFSGLNVDVAQAALDEFDTRARNLESSITEVMESTVRELPPEVHEMLWKPFWEKYRAQVIRQREELQQRIKVGM